MSRYEIICGKAEIELPKLAERLDLSDVCIVTDPPYGTGGWRRTVSGAGDDPSGSLIVEDWDEGATTWLSLLPSAVPILSFWSAAKTAQLLNAANAHGLMKHRALYMRKPDPKPMVGGRMKYSVEPVWALSQDGFLLYSGDDMFTASTPRLGRDSDAMGHPYQKPLAFMRWLISKVKAQTIVDPFAGSFTTGVAALHEGRNFIGIEQDESYCHIGEARLKRASGEWAEIPRLNRKPYAPAPLFEQTEL